MSRRTHLKRLLYPKSIAVFGGQSARTVVRQCRDIGFVGPIWAVHPNANAVDGALSFSSIDELPGIPDACFIGVSADVTIDIVTQLQAIGAGGAVCFASGFAEISTEGSERQRKLLEAAQQMPIVGPNCHGTINALDGIALWPDHHGCRRVEKGAALIVQSGNIGINLSFQQRGLDVSHIVAVGNSAQLALHDYIDVLLDDERVTAIGLHVEGLRAVPEFSKVAIKALRKGVPIVAIKSGNSTLGAQMTMSHTNSLASERELVASFFKRFGIAQAGSLEEFVETLKFVSIAGVLQNNRIASMSCSGGEASLVADLADEINLELPKLSTKSVDMLRSCLGEKVHITNPLDYHNYVWGDQQGLLACFTAVMSNNFDCCFLVLDYPASGVDDPAWLKAEDALVQAQKATGGTAVLVSTLPENLPSKVRTRLKVQGIAPMQGLRTCIQAIKAAVLIGQAQLRFESMQVVNDPVEILGSRKVVNEWQSKQLLAKHGLVIPEGRFVGASDVIQAAQEIGYPVVLKAISDTLVHKSEMSAVAVNLSSQTQLEQALARMRNLTKRFLVERMVQNVSLELLVGIKQDAEFGLVLVIGAGGTDVELLKDTVNVPLPADTIDIRSALDCLTISAKFDGFRGNPPADIDAAVSAIKAIVGFAQEYRQTLNELDVNPLMVKSLEPGSSTTDQGAVVADAFMAIVTG